MRLTKILGTVLTGVLLTAVLPANISFAQNTLKIMRGSTTNAISVKLNRAIVMESEQPFAEISVANPSIADIATLSDRTIYVLGKSPGRTVLTLLGPNGKLITNVDVKVTPDLSELKELLREILPREPIQVRSANDGIVLSGTVSGARKVSLAMELAERYAPNKVTNLLLVGGAQQVLLKIRFAEMKRSVAKSLNASIGILKTTGSGAGNAFSSGPSGVASIVGTATGFLDMGFTTGGFAISVLLEALETKGLIRTLAEPTLVAMSGAEANFLAGGEFPIPVAQDNDSGAITIEYKVFGIEMKFIPTVIDGDLINLVIDTSVSAIDETNSIDTGVGDGIPAFTKRQASTVVELRDGQSLSIAGLLQDDFRDVAAQVPWLGDVPILGALFRSADYTSQQTELVIIVTAHLITPVDGDTLSLPTDRVILPSENDLFLRGHVEGGKKTVRRGTVAAQDFSGSYGYVME